MEQFQDVVILVNAMWAIVQARKCRMGCHSGVLCGWGICNGGKVIKGENRGVYIGTKWAGSSTCDMITYPSSEEIEVGFACATIDVILFFAGQYHFVFSH